VGGLRAKGNLISRDIRLDRSLFIITLLLVILGLVAIADASAPTALERFSDRFFYVKEQFTWAVVGVALMVVFSKVDYKLWSKLAIPLFILSVVLLIAVVIPGVGIKIFGARRWLDLGFTTFQPSEFAKLAVSIYIARVSVSKNKLLPFLLPVVLVTALIMLQPDLGTAVVLLGSAIVQIFVSGISVLALLIVGFIGSIAVAVLIRTSAYRWERFLTFLSQTKDPLGSDYHIRQVLIALGTGGMWGVGLGLSRQKFLFLPETATDSIFAIIAEEVGFSGSLILILLFVIYFLLGYRVVKFSPDRFSCVLSTGILSWIAIQFLLNIGSMVAAVPLTGIPLPFISFGGTSLVVNLVGTGILLNISKYAKAKV